MVFLVIIAFVGALIGVLAYIDNANVQKIEDFLQQQQCKEINYTKGNYQALCDDKLIVVENGFKVDLGDAKIVYYKVIENIQDEDKKLIVQSRDKQTLLEFKTNEDKTAFFDKLKEKQR